MIGWRVARRCWVAVHLGCLGYLAGYAVWLAVVENRWWPLGILAVTPSRAVIELSGRNFDTIFARWAPSPTNQPVDTKSSTHYSHNH